MDDETDFNLTSKEILKNQKIYDNSLLTIMTRKSPLLYGEREAEWSRGSTDSITDFLNTSFKYSASRCNDKPQLC